MTSYNELTMRITDPRCQFGKKTEQGGNEETLLKQEKRPTDVLGDAVHICKIANAEIEDDQGSEGKSVPNWTEGGRIGGPKRAAVLSFQRRIDIARIAANSRWVGLQAGVISPNDSLDPDDTGSPR